MDSKFEHPITGSLFDSPVVANTGWPGDLTKSDTPTAKNVTQIKAIAKQVSNLTELSAAVSLCKACPRLVKWRIDVAITKRKSFADQPYWGRPATGFGSTGPKLLVVGLAPAAHGANRTGRIFTGDKSGDWLYRAMHKAGFANQPTSEHAGDGLELIDARVLAAVRCAPPANKPTPKERDNCSVWLQKEFEFLQPGLKVIVALGSFGWEQAVSLLQNSNFESGSKIKFGHGAQVQFHKPGCNITLLGSYHPSQQNTFTGRLTEPMIDSVFSMAAKSIKN
jgi:uracil-DNA glycosylase family 4